MYDVKFPSLGLLSRETPGSPPEGSSILGDPFPGSHPEWNLGRKGAQWSPQARDLSRDSFRPRPLWVTWRPPHPAGVWTAIRGIGGPPSSAVGRAAGPLPGSWDHLVEEGAFKPLSDVTALPPSADPRPLRAPWVIGGGSLRGPDAKARLPSLQRSTPSRGTPTANPAPSPSSMTTSGSTAAPARAARTGTCGVPPPRTTARTSAGASAPSRVRAGRQGGRLALRVRAAGLWGLG